jgi:homoserine kinase
LKLHLAVRAQVAPEFSVTARGRDTEICGALGGNLVLETYCQLLEAEGRAIQPLALRVHNHIPIGKGFGSSAAARLAGVVLAAHFGGLSWGDERIPEEAARREGHADNTVACWLGGVGLAQTSGNEFCAVNLRAPAWPLLLAVSPETLSTEKARAILPQQVARGDAVANLQSAILLLAAFAEGRFELLRRALHDRLHEPYRASLCPLLEPLRELAGRDGILGAVLSGAGPSVLMVLEPGASERRVRQTVCEYLRQRGVKAELLLTSIEQRGAKHRRRELADVPKRTQG